MKKLLLLLFALAPSLALAQNTSWPPPAGAVAFLGVYNAVPPTMTDKSAGFAQLDANGNLKVAASVSATVTGFAPSLAYATCTAAGTACASTALPTNTGSVILFNAGTTTVSCTLAAGAATALASELQIPASSGLPLATVYGATTYDHFSCIDQSGSTSNTVIASGGSGLPTGWGGGGSGGGGAVTLASGAVSSGAYSSGSIASGAYASGSIGSGAIVDLGAQADAAWSGSGSGSGIAILKAIYGAAITGAATNGATYPASSIGIGWKDGSGNIQPAAAATPFPITQFLGPTATVNEPCRTGTKVTKPISQAASAVIITHTTTLKTYICGGSFNLSDAESVSITEGTGTVCATGQVALMGSTTVANGMALAANEGMSLGSGGSSNIVANTGGDDICLLQSGTGRAAGWVTYVQQ